MFYKTLDQNKLILHFFLIYFLQVKVFDKKRTRNADFAGF